MCLLDGGLVAVDAMYATHKTYSRKERRRI